LGALAVGAVYASSQDEDKNVAYAASEPPSDSLAQNTVVTGNIAVGGFLISKRNDSLLF
jgi:hypothetical protein